VEAIRLVVSEIGVFAGLFVDICLHVPRFLKEVYAASFFSFFFSQLNAYSTEFLV
jgi:hypothetical protein